MLLESILILALNVLESNSFFSDILTDFRHFSREDSRVVFPQIQQVKTRRKRHINRNLYYDQIVPATTINLDEFVLDLNEDESSLDIHENFRIIFENPASESAESILDNCRFQSGKIRDFEDVSFGSVTICGSEIIGFIRIDDDSYLIEPFNITAGQFQANIPHILYKTNHPNRKRSVRELHESQWEYFNLTGDTINFDGLDDDNFPDGGGNFSENNTVQFGLTQPEVDVTLFDWNTQEIDPDIMGYFVDSIWESRIISK